MKNVYLAILKLVFGPVNATANVAHNFLSSGNANHLMLVCTLTQLLQTQGEKNGVGTLIQGTKGRTQSYKNL